MCYALRVTLDPDPTRQLKKRNEYQHEITELKARGNSRPVPKKSSPPPSFDTLDLDEVEKKLDKARLEYQRRLQEVQTLNLVNFNG